MKVVYHPSVQRDVTAILHYYDRISADLGNAFWEELLSVIIAASENPRHFHPERMANDLRRAGLRRFPYHFLFRVVPEGIRVVAVRHDRRHPSHGLARK